MLLPCRSVADEQRQPGEQRPVPEDLAQAAERDQHGDEAESAREPGEQRLADGPARRDGVRLC